MTLVGLIPTAGSGVFLAADDVTSLTMLDYIKSGGFVGWLLLVLSFVALALIITNLIRLRRSALVPDQLIRELDRRARERDIHGVAELCNAPECDSAVTRVLGPALKRCGRSQFGLMELRTAVEESGKKEMDRLLRPTELIGLIAAIGPMLGLLGTVLGMVGAFGAIGKLEGAARSKELATFMSMALVNTAEGLIVAIPCTVAYALFKRKTEHIGDEIGELMDEWIGPLQQVGDTVAAAPAAAMPRPQPKAVPAAAAVRGVRPA